MEIKGQIEEIVYTNEENSYTVCTLSLEDDTMLTAVGYLPFISVGDVVVLYGKMVNHNMYGEQFKIDTFEKIMPEGIKQIEKYLFPILTNTIICVIMCMSGGKINEKLLVKRGA